MRVFVEAVGVLAPGLKDWSQAKEVLSGQQAYLAAPLQVVTPACLPSAERRRSSANVRLAIAAAEQGLAHTTIPSAKMAMVFASREASGTITQQICEVLAGTREVSPTQFHNSVHNAPSGYYSIAMQATLSANSVCRGPWTFAAGLLNAAAQAMADNVPTLLVCYDSPMPAPLSDVLPVSENTAIALVLTPNATPHSLAQWDLSLTSGLQETSRPHWIPKTWDANASACGLTALAMLADPACNSTVLSLSPTLQLQLCCS